MCLFLIHATKPSPINKFFIALAQYPLCNPQENTANRTSSRVVTGISSILQKNDLGGVAKDLFINEVTAEMRKQFGYGCTGEFIVNLSVSIIAGFYRNY